MTFKNIRHFLRRNFPAIVGMFFLIDWLEILPEATIYWGKPRVLQFESSPFFDFVIEHLSADLAITQDATIYLLWLLTAFSALGLFFNRTEGWSALVTWLLSVFWMSSRTGSLNGVHFYISICLLLIFLSAWVGDQNTIWQWGKILLCSTYFNAGYAKIISPQWRSGGVLWIIIGVGAAKKGALNMKSLEAFYPLLLAVNWLVMFSQLFSPIILWKRNLTRYWLWLDCGTHAAIGLFLGLYHFSAMLIFLNLVFLDEKISHRFNLAQFEAESPGGILDTRVRE